jgi:hypothetical protein
VQTQTRIDQAPDHRNVLLVTGADIVPPNAEDANAEVRAALERAVAPGADPPPGTLTSPVRPGTHDFWIVYTVDAGTRTPPNAGIQVPGDTPRPLRGGVVAKRPPTTSDDGTVVSQLTTLLQEVGHYWLAYQGLHFAYQGHEVPYERADWDKFNHDRPFEGPLIGGRGLLHWGPWFDTTNSPMGGRNWSTVTRDGIYDRWQWEHLPDGPHPQPAGLHQLTLDARYCDLDLLVMGAKTADQCYPETGGTFRWLEPRYVVQPRFLATHPELGWPFLAGVFVAYDENDFIYFGFDGDHRQLGVYRTDRTRLGGPVGLGTAYTPGWLPHSGVALRVVRQGRVLHFQARLDDNALGLRISPSDHNVFVGAPPDRIPGLFQDLAATGGSPGDFTRWQTVAGVVDGRAPVAIGLIATTAWPTLLDAVFCNLETVALPRFPTRKLVSRVHHLSPVPPRWTSGTSYASLPDGDPRLDLPAGDLDPLQAQDWNRRLRMLLPYSVTDGETGITFEHLSMADRAPKVLLKAPAGDFAFGTALAVRRTLYARNSGGGAYPTQIWGQTRTLHATDVRLDPAQAVNRMAPPQNTYKTAFIIAARQRTDITDAMIQSVDVVRRYWDPAFSAATGGLRRSDSSL